MNVLDFMSPSEADDVLTRSRKIDVTSAIQDAISSDPGTLHFPPGDYCVTPGSKGHALLVDSQSIQISGDDATIFMASQGNHQALRLENCKNSSIRNLRFQGSGTNGSNGGQGLVQVYLGANFEANACIFDDANCDGIAIAGVEGVTLAGCSSKNASKVAFYVNNSSKVNVSNNIASGFGGHRVGERIVGAGLQLSGNKSLKASGNFIFHGVGIGILCDNSHSILPIENTISLNAVDHVANPTNPQVSCGIRLSCTTSGKGQSTEVSGNTAINCGSYNYYFENHANCTIENNLGICSIESNFVFSFISRALVNNNTAVNSNVQDKQGQAAFYILHKSRGIIGRNNGVVESSNSWKKSRVMPLIDKTNNRNLLLVEIERSSHAKAII